MQVAKNRIGVAPGQRYRVGVARADEIGGNGVDEYVRKADGEGLAGGGVYTGPYKIGCGMPLLQMQRHIHDLRMRKFGRDDAGQLDWRAWRAAALHGIQVAV